MKSFEESLLAVMSQAEARELLSVLQAGETPKTIRLNVAKKAQLNPEFKQADLFSDALQLKSERPLFAQDPAWHAGAYYVQEANSMWVGRCVQEHLSTLEGAAAVLDLCAAPGGKSTHLSSVLRPGDILVANEVIASRAAILHENVSKWGLGNVVVTRADAERFGEAGPQFDIICVDAPCSGEGMFRKNEEAHEEWSPEVVQLCSARQQRIVHDVWPALKPGGLLVYSTCTYNRHENEDNVLRFERDFGAKRLFPNIPAEAGSLQLEEGMHRFYPGRSAGEGFFLALLQKPEGEWIAAKPGKKKKGAVTPVLHELPAADWVLTQAGSSLYAVRSGAWTQQFFLTRLPGLLHPGVEVGDVFKGKWKPHPAMALLADSPIATWVDLDDQQVMTYLRREFVSGSFGFKGPVGVRWRGISVGTANALGHGLNNLWPQGWRLRNSEFQAQSLLL